MVTIYVASFLIVIPTALFLDIITHAGFFFTQEFLDQQTTYTFIPIKFAEIAKWPVLIATLLVYAYIRIIIDLKNESILGLTKFNTRDSVYSWGQKRWVMDGVSRVVIGLLILVLAGYSTAYIGRYLSIQHNAWLMYLLTFFQSTLYGGVIFFTVPGFLWIEKAIRYLDILKKDLRKRQERRDLILQQKQGRK